MTRGSQAHAGGRDLEDRVQAAIREGLSTGDLQKKDVARELGISARSLDRELARGGTSYREIVEGLRLKLAERDLKDTRCKLEDLSRQLGYANPSNFTRAFRRWTGETPRDFRNRVGAKWQDPPNR